MTRFRSAFTMRVKGSTVSNQLRSVIPAATVVFVALSGHAVWGQMTKPIKMVVPYAPGGGVDALARIVAAGHGGRRW